MIGNRVKVFMRDGDEWTNVTGTLRKIGPEGVTIYRECPISEGEGVAFIPVHRVYEVTDLGRTP